MSEKLSNLEKTEIGFGQPEVNIIAESPISIRTNFAQIQYTTLEETLNECRKVLEKHLELMKDKGDIKFPSMLFLQGVYYLGI